MIASDLSTITVDRFYAVPRILYRFSRAAGYHHRDVRVWIPSQGPLHSDPELGATFKHYHYDARFISDALLAYLQFPSVESALIFAPNVNRIEGGPVLKRRRCCRIMPTVTLSEGNRLFLREKVESRYQDCRIDWNNPICPHRGFSLKGLPVNADGTITCPGHQLKWCRETGRLVSQVQEC